MNLLASLSAWWNDLDQRRRIAFAAGIVAVAIAIGVFAWFSLRSDYVPLAADLSKEDTAAVVAELEDFHASYRVDASSGALLVPAEQADGIRTQLARKGWQLKSAPGFELFDNGDFGMTDFTERINYQRALEGELARTIMALDYVRFARVHLVLPESSLFKKAAETPKASVLLIGRKGEVISQAQISGVQRMIASAVPDLKPDAVSVHDHKGVELTGGSASAVSPSAVAAEIKAQSDVEDYLTAKADEILARIFPRGSATVSVNAVLSRSHVSSSRDEVLPSGQGSGAVSRIRSDTLPEGAVLPTSHLAHDASPSKGNDQGPQFDVEYRIGHVTEQSESAPGGIERISVGVVIPDPAQYGTTADAVRDLVAAGVGLDVQRGDRIAVYPVAGQPGAGLHGQSDAVPSAIPALASGGVAGREHPEWVLWLGFALLGAALVALLWRPSRPRLTAAEREELLRQLKSWLQA